MQIKCVATVPHAALPLPLPNHLPTEPTKHSWPRATDLAPTASPRPLPLPSPPIKGGSRARLSPHLLSGPSRSCATLLLLNPGAPPPAGGPHAPIFYFGASLASISS
jgi:hypothetical protein